MEQVTVSSNGQVAIPKSVRDALNLSEGTKLTVEVRGQTILLSILLPKDPAWKKLHGAGAGSNQGLDLMNAFAAHRKQERDLEDARP